MPDTPARPATAPRPTRSLSIRDQVNQQLSSPAYTGIRAYPMWLPPLTFPTALNTLLERDAAQHPEHTHLHIPLGLIDNPKKHSQLVWSIELTGSDANAAIAGATNSGKSTLLLTMIMSGAATHSPRDLQFYCLDFSSNLLLHTVGLPHVGAVAVAHELPKIRRIVAELKALVGRRLLAFAQHAVVDMDHYRRLRSDSNHPLSTDPFGDAVLVVDGWAGLTEDHPDDLQYQRLVQDVTYLASKGPGVGVHVVATTTRWTTIRQSIRDLLGLKIELFSADPDSSPLNVTGKRNAIKSIPSKIPGRAMSSEYLHLMIGAPRFDGRNTMADIGDTYPQSRELISRKWAAVPAAPRIETLPDRIDIEEVLDRAPRVTPEDSYARRWTIPIGLAESTMEPAVANLAEYPHLLVFGESKKGRTTALRSAVKSILRQNNPSQVAFVIIDYRASLLGLVPEEYQLPTMYLRNPGDLQRGANSSPEPQGRELTTTEQLLRQNPIALLAQYLDSRKPPHDLSPQQLRARSWWSGYDIVLLIDNWEIVTQSHTAGISALGPELSQYIMAASDLGFHLIVSCHMRQANAVLTRGILNSAYGVSSSTILLSAADKGDFPSGREFTVGPRPAGQALYKTGNELEVIQTAYSPPPDE